MKPPAERSGAFVVSLRREIEGEVWLAIGGIVSIVFGVYLTVFPGSGLVSLRFLVVAVD